MDDFIGKIFTIGGFTGKFMEIPSMKGPEFFASDSQESADFPAIQWLPFSVRIQVPSLESTLAPLRILEISPRDFVRPYVPYGGKRVDGESGSSLFRGIFGHLCSETGYPLVNCYITMERSTIFNGLINYKRPFSIAMMFVYQKVIP